MQNLVNIIKQIRETSSTNGKREILEANKDNKWLQLILEYTYNPFKKYGITEKVFEKYTSNYVNNENFFELLNELAVSNINDDLRNRLVSLVNGYEDEEIQDMLKCIACKDLKLGANITAINKVWKGLIPKFDVQLARKFGDVKLSENELIFVTEKLDGIRCLIIKENQNVRMFTRQGKEIVGLNEVRESVVQTFKDQSVVIDGELLLFNSDNLDSGTLYRATVKVVNSKSENKTGIIYNVFDMMSVEDFKNGESSEIYSTRRRKMEQIEWKNQLVLTPLLYQGTDHNKIFELLKQVEEQNKEGLMVNRNVCYQCKRTNGLLKVKTMQTADLKVIGYEAGTGRLDGTLGALIVDYKGYPVKVGSGYSDTMRDKLWEHKKNVIGKIVEVQYFEESTNEQGGLSLRFPVFKYVRTDKTEPSYN